MIPLFHDFTGGTVLVFGGGTVGTRKARRFAAEATVVVVSPSFEPGLLELSVGDPAVALVRAAPRDADIVERWIDRTAPTLVVAATDDPDVNAITEAAARRAGVLVNRTDVAGGRTAGSVIVPATIENGPVRVAISTDGTSPALTKALRERIEPALDGVGAMAELSASLRRELMDRDVPPEVRRDAIRAVVRSERVWKALHEEGSNGRNEAERVIQEVVSE